MSQLANVDNRQHPYIAWRRTDTILIKFHTHTDRQTRSAKNSSKLSSLAIRLTGVGVGSGSNKTAETIPLSSEAYNQHKILIIKILYIAVHRLGGYTTGTNATHLLASEHKQFNFHAYLDYGMCSANAVPVTYK
jgi:hypothetical protein